MKLDDPDDLKSALDEISRIVDEAKEALNDGTFVVGNAIHHGLETLATASEDDFGNCMETSDKTWEQALVVLRRMLNERDSGGVVALEHACDASVLTCLREEDEELQSNIDRLEQAIATLGSMKRTLKRDLKAMAGRP